MTAVRSPLESFTRLASVAALAASAGLPSQADAQQARVPVKVYLIAPADQPDKATMLTSAKPVTHEVKHVASSWGGQLFTYLNDGPDCQPTELTTTVEKPPDHGRLFLRDITLPPIRYIVAAFPKGDPRGDCQRLSMRNGFYQPDPGFTGRDHAVVSFREGDASFTDNIEIDVRRAERPNPLTTGR